MLEDVNGGIAWTLAHAAEHGGDPQRTYLVGQSCGAQLAALSLVTQARARAAAPPAAQRRTRGSAQGSRSVRGRERVTCMRQRVSSQVELGLGTLTG